MYYTYTERGQKGLPTPITIGQISAAIALAVGILFFIYALKYYLSVIIILFGGVTPYGMTNRANNTNHSGVNNILKWRKNNRIQNNHINNINTFNHINSKNGEDFVSIHLPIYNEKHVINRLLEACTSINYKNYEIIVVDDSTDETTGMLHERWDAHPKIKIVHRKDRSGFKGGALNEALKYMDRRTKYVLVLDADFIPPPDIIHRFLWFFENPSQNSFNNFNHNHNNNNRNNNNHNSNNHNNIPWRNFGNHKNNNNNNNNHNSNDIIRRISEWYKRRELAAVQGYQWHILNASENWITRGVRFEYSGNYVIERSCQEVLSLMKMIAGSVFMVRADILRKYEWSHSLTEDWELTLKLYIDGYKVLFTPLIYAPAECPSTFRRLARQRMRWAEGHTYNVKKYFRQVLSSPNLSLGEKIEFASYYTPYYLQSLLFVMGTVLWFVSEYSHIYLPFWTVAFGWSLVLTNLLALPLMGVTGLFLEKSAKRDFIGAFSFIVLSYVLAPFQAYASLKGLIERHEGAWFRTFKTGKITEALWRLELRKVLRRVLPRRGKKESKESDEAKKTKGATQTDGGVKERIGGLHSKNQKIEVEGKKETNRSRLGITYTIGQFMIISSAITLLSLPITSFFMVSPLILALVAGLVTVAVAIEGAQLPQSFTLNQNILTKLSRLKTIIGGSRS